MKKWENTKKPFSSLSTTLAKSTLFIAGHRLKMAREGASHVWVDDPNCNSHTSHYIKRDQGV